MGWEAGGGISQGLAAIRQAWLKTPQGVRFRELGSYGEYGRRPAEAAEFSKLRNVYIKLGMTSVEQAQWRREMREAEAMDRAADREAAAAERAEAAEEAEGEREGTTPISALELSGKYTSKELQTMLRQAGLTWTGTKEQMAKELRKQGRL